MTPLFLKNAARAAALLGLIASVLTMRTTAGGQSAPRLILQSPTISATQIAFVYGGDIWTVDRGGGAAHRIVTGFGLASDPYFSPDGSRIAFSAMYDGNIDVYVVAAGGGQPKRVTFHPAADIAVGWTPDGKNIIFRSGRSSSNDSRQLFLIPPAGGVATVLPLPDAQEGTFDATMSHFAYVPNGQWEPYWQDYRGGQTTPVWIAEMSDSAVTEVPRHNSNDRDPMWIGQTVYFLSDRDGPFTLFAYDPRTHAVRRLLPSGGFGIVAASANGNDIAYSTFDALHVYNVATGTDRAVPVTLADEMPEIRPHWIDVGKEIQNADISPTGVRAVFEAHGQIITVPAENGSIRNLTPVAGVAHRDPAWSPDGKWIAYFSDASNEYDLRIRDQRGLEPERRIALEPQRSFYYTPRWSPDSKRIAYADKHNGIYYVDANGTATPVKVGEQQISQVPFDGAWSPDSRYLAYSQVLPNYERAIVVYDTVTHERHQVTDGMSDASSPSFDLSGKYLYFLASTNTGLNADGSDMESDQRPTSSFAYAITLQSDVSSPTAPLTAEEPGGDEPAGGASPAPSPTPKPAASPTPPPVKAIDFSGIGQRIVSLPLPEANYAQLSAAAGSVLASAGPVATVADEDGPQPLSLTRFDLATRKVTPLGDGIFGFTVSHDGKKMLLHTAGGWYIAAADAAFKNDGKLATDSMRVYSEPQREWAQMFRETWRIEREFFYDPNYHGLDLAKAQAVFATFLPALASRADLSYLTRQMIGYLEVGHLWVGGGSVPAMQHVQTGLLGADYTFENGHVRFAHIYGGDNWNPALRAPLTGPGVNVHAGDYLLAVNGNDVSAAEDIYRAFEQTANVQTTITVGPNPDRTGSRNMIVVPIASEFNIRNLAWTEHNREVVSKLSGDKLAYVYMPDTEYAGFTNFNRYFFAQVGREGVILDERYNHGGQIADYVIDMLGRKPLAIAKERDGKPMMVPPQAFYGPKVMLVNGYAGSGGDAMPWLFRKAGLGPIVGERTWGGLIGIGGYPRLIDGGSVMAPRFGIGGLNGKWEVEGNGVTPDVTVAADPKLWREGHDAQLEAAVRVAMNALKAHPVPQYRVPPYPDHHPVLPSP